jgi:Tol biopolymer transport system component
MIAYRAMTSDRGQHQLIWVDREGRELDKVVYDGNAALGPALSADGRHVAVFRYLQGNMDIWSYDRTRRLWERLTRDPGDDIFPLWSRDARSIVYAGVRNGQPLALFRRAVGAPPESEQALLKTPGGAFPMDWSSTGEFLLFTRPDVKRAADIWALSLSGHGAEPFEVAATDANEGYPQFSPDGRWIAYQSDTSGRDEVYLRPFPVPREDVRVSLEGGSQVRWNPNGRELFFLGADDRMMAAPIRFGTVGSDVDIGTPVALFQTRIGSSVPLKYRAQFAVTPDGNGFLLNSTVQEGTAPPIVVILNWKPPR